MRIEEEQAESYDEKKREERCKMAPEREEKVQDQWITHRRDFDDLESNLVSQISFFLFPINLIRLKTSLSFVNSLLKN